MGQKAKNDQTATRLRQNERLRKILLDLPECCYDFILSIEPNTSLLTRINYAGDLRIFFQYLHDALQLFHRDVPELTPDDIRAIQPKHIEQFLNYLSFYESGDRVLQNQNLGKKRKLSAVRTFFKYMLKHGDIPALPTAIIDTPKVPGKPIVRLEREEVGELLDGVQSGAKQTKHQEAYLKATALRDMALLKLMLGTGIRVSECINLNITDLDFSHKSFRVLRKGGKEAILYFSDDILQALQEYMVQRKTMMTVPGHEQALFLSLQRRRITARAVENLVEKYTKTAVPLKRITPHKLRSTFGTALYRATGDIYLVADVLGHKDINTTRKHYADMSEENRKRAADAVKYTEKDEQ